MQLNSLTRTLCTLAVSISMLAHFQNAHAQSIGVNFTGGSNLLAPTDQPGVVPGANFNNVVGGSGTSVSNLLDSSGASTSTSLTINSAGGDYDSYSIPNTSNPATNTMYSGGLFGDGTGGPNSEDSITVSNIAYSQYAVYVYSSSDTSNSNTLSDTIGGTTFYYSSNGMVDSNATSLLPTTSTDPANPTLGPGQYQIFSDLTGSSFTLTTAGSISGTISNNVFGLQIVNTAPPVPEPATYALLGSLGVTGATFLRRRKFAR